MLLLLFGNAQKKGTDELYNELLSRLQQIPDAWRTWIWEVFRIVYNKHGDSKHGNTSWSFIEMGWGLSCSWDSLGRQMAKLITGLLRTKSGARRTGAWMSCHQGRPAACWARWQGSRRQLTKWLRTFDGKTTWSPLPSPVASKIQGSKQLILGLVTPQNFRTLSGI